VLIRASCEGCSEYIRTTDCLNSFLQILCTGMQDDTEAVRRVACLALSRVADVCQPEAAAYHANVLPLLFAAMAPPSTKEVIEVAAFALESFIDNMEAEITEYAPLGYPASRARCTRAHTHTAPHDRARACAPTTPRSPCLLQHKAWWPLPCIERMKRTLHCKVLGATDGAPRADGGHGRDGAPSRAQLHGNGQQKTSTTISAWGRSPFDSVCSASTVRPAPCGPSARAAGQTKSTWPRLTRNSNCC